MSYVPYQDLEVRTIKKSSKQINYAKKDKGKSETVLKYNAGKNKQTSSKNVKYDDDDLPKAPAKVSHSLKMQIQKARTGKKLSQKDLANKCSLPVATIKSYENGTAVPDNQTLNKLRRVLGKLSK